MLSRLHLRRNLVTGLLTVIPLWVTWLVLGFIFRLLSEAGGPAARWIGRTLRDRQPELARLLSQGWFQSLVAVALVVVVLYVLGWFASQVIGKRLIAALEAMVLRVPGVKPVYGLVKKLLEALDQKPGDVQRVVLIEFPNPHMKTVGLVTRTLRDEVSGRLMAAVYVPTTPNPTSGYLEIVPIERVVATDWTIDEAMSFIVSGGAVAPGALRYTNEPPEPDSAVEAVEEGAQAARAAERPK